MRHRFGASSQVYGEVDHREPEKHIGHSDDYQSEVEQAFVRPRLYHGPMM